MKVHKQPPHFLLFQPTRARRVSAAKNVIAALEREESADRATFQRPPRVLKSLGMRLRWKSHFFCFFGNNQFALSLYAALTR